MDNNVLFDIFSSTTPSVISSVSSLASLFLTQKFLKSNTSTQQFEIVKLDLLKGRINDLLSNGTMTYTELFEAKNTLEVAKKTDRYFSKQIDLIDHPIDVDIIIRIFNSVANISNENIQELWAKILAGKINKPGSTSIQTIEVLNRLGEADARLFEIISAYAINAFGNIYIPNYDSFLRQFHIKYADIIRLDELGLIHSNTMLSIQINESNYVINDSYMLTVIFNNDHTLVYNIKEFPFTKAGRDIFNALSIDYNEECLVFWGKELKKDKNITIHISKIESVNGNIYTCDEKDILSE